MFFNRFTCIKQINENDCGVACIAMILKRYKVRYNFLSLKEKCNLSNNGMKVKDIVNVFKQYNFTVNIFKANKDEDIFKMKKFPYISNIVIDNKYFHFIVIHKVTSKYIVYSDPVIGVQKIDFNVFFKDWTGIIIYAVPNKILEKEKIKIEKKNLNFKILGEMISKIILSNKKILCIAFLLSVIITFINIFCAIYIKYIFNYIIPDNLKTYLNIFSISLIILLVSSNILSGLREQLVLYFSKKVDISIVLFYFKKIISLPMSFFNSKTTGDIISRLEDSYKIRIAISNITISIIVDFFMIIIGGIALIIQSEKMFFLTLIPVIMYIISIVIFKRFVDKVNIKTMRAQSILIEYMNESISNIETIKIFNQQIKTQNKIEEKFINYIENTFNVGYISNIQTTINKLIKSIFMIIILWYGTYEVLNGDISSGSLLAFNSLLAYFLTPILNIVRLQNSIQSANIALYRLAEITNLNDDKLIKVDKLINLNENIDFRDVSFSYNNNILVLNSISFSIKGGEKIALVGESGSGKTTLVKILLKLYDLESGSIQISGHNINDLSPSLIRNKILYISQDVYLFYGSIIDNLTLGDNIELEKVMFICKKIGIDDFVNKLPYKYQTIIEESGSNLSGGQKQRLAIARAILRNPDILILDEITSNLDAVSEKIIIDFINEFLKDKTIFIISHRFSTIKNCTKILVLKNGKLIESGEHKRLIQLNGYYSELLKAQENK